MTPEVRAKQAIAEEQEHEAAAVLCRQRRDAAIHDMHAEDDSLSQAEIARRLGISPSLVRLALRLPKPDVTDHKRR